MEKTLLLPLLFIFFAVELMAQTQQVGFTTYDLQTNNATCRRVATNAAGEVAITYTRSHIFSSSSLDRGTGYNFWDNSSWSEDFSSFNNNSPGQFNRPDVGRSGWSNIALLKSGREVVVSHIWGNTSISSGLQVLYRDNPGVGAWNSVELNETADAGSAWPRIAVSGDSIIIISAVSIGTFVNGVDGGLNVHRSFDGGETWTDIDVIDVINDDYFKSIGSDVYSIDANDNGVIAIVAGRYQINLIKSLDFGETWTISPIKQTFDTNGNLNPANFSATFGETLDTVDLSDESYSVVVDDNGLTHVWYGRQRLWKNSASSNGTFFQPFETGLMYWNENMEEPKLLHQTRLPAEQVEQCAPLFSNDFNLNQFQTQTYRTSLTSQPSGGFASNGNLYVAYSAIRAAILDANDNVTNFSIPDNLHFRDIFVLKSEDNGQTWTGPYNLSNEERKECAYPSIPRKIYNDIIPILWQEDTIPGNALQPPQGMNHPFVENKMNLAFVEDSDIVSPLDVTCPTINLVNTSNTTITVAQGCPINEETILGIIEIDDIPQGPDFNLLQSNFDINNYDVPGSYTVSLWAEDNANNLSSDTIEGITIIVLEDLINPTIEFVGFDTLSVIIGETFEDPGINFSDNGCEPSLTNEVDNVNPTSGQTNGTFGSYSYIVVDNAGNSTTAIRYVEFILTDITPPTITLLGNEIEEIEACEIWTDPNAVAFDDIDFDLTNEIVVTGGNNIDIFTPADYIITYTVEDNAGNQTSIERIVKVEDTTPPEINVNDENGVWYAYLGDPIVLPFTSVFDCVDSNPSLTNNTNTQVNTNNIGNYLVTFTAEDFSGNISNATSNFIVGIEPTADFELTQINQDVIVSNTSTGSPTFWRWDYGNGQVFQGPNPPIPTYLPSDPTFPTYEICLTVRNRFNDPPFNKPVSEKCETITFCNIINLTAGLQSECDSSSNTYTQDITVSYSNPPSLGQLNVNGQTFNITSSPQTVTLTGLNSNGSPVDVTAFFTSLNECTYTDINLFNAPDFCQCETISYNISTVADTSAQNTGCISLTDVSGGIPPYTFSLNQGFPQTNSEFCNLGAGNYTVNITDADNCSTSILVDISLVNSIQDLKLEDLKLFPVPASEQVSLQFNTSEKEISFRVVNTLGETMHAENIDTKSGVFAKTLNVSNFASGVYFIHLVGKDKASSLSFVINR